MSSAPVSRAVRLALAAALASGVVLLLIVVAMVEEQRDLALAIDRARLAEYERLRVQGDEPLRPVSHSRTVAAPGPAIDSPPVRGWSLHETEGVPAERNSPEERDSAALSVEWESPPVFASDLVAPVAEDERPFEEETEVANAALPPDPESSGLGRELEVESPEAEPSEAREPARPAAGIVATQAPEAHEPRPEAVTPAPESSPGVTVAPYRRRYGGSRSSAAAEGLEPEDAEAAGVRETSARDFALDYFDAWSSDNAVAAGSLTHFYGGPVLFYGKRITREQLSDEKRRFMRRWPERRYTHRPETLEARCSSDDVCTVSSVYDYKVVSRAGRRARGAQEFHLQVAFPNGRPAIVAEDGRPLGPAAKLATAASRTADASRR